MPVDVAVLTLVCGIALLSSVARQLAIVRTEDKILREMGIPDMGDGSLPAAAYPGRPASVVRDAALPSWSRPHSPVALNEFIQRFGRIEQLKFTEGGSGPCERRRIGELSHIRELSLPRGCGLVDDRICEQIGRLSKLEILHLSENPIGDEGVRHLAALSRLEWLTLSCTNVTDRAIDDLLNLKRLRFLSLRRCNVSDHGIRRLSALPKLEHLNVKGTAASIQTDLVLRKANPELNVEFDH